MALDASLVAAPCCGETLAAPGIGAARLARSWLHARPWLVHSGPGNWGVPRRVAQGEQCRPLTTDGGSEVVSAAIGPDTGAHGSDSEGLHLFRPRFGPWSRCSRSRPDPREDLESQPRCQSPSQKSGISSTGGLNLGPTIDDPHNRHRTESYPHVHTQQGGEQTGMLGTSHPQRVDVGALCLAGWRTKPSLVPGSLCP